MIIKGNFNEAEVFTGNIDDETIWLAHYTKQTSYKGDYVMWQLSSNGKVDGINNYVDINVYYKN